MKIAIFTLTKDRYAYTKRMVESLSKKTQLDYDHFIIDQGSTDKTIEYLSNFTHGLGNLYLYELGMNIGINRGVNFAIDKIGDKYDIIIKMDNDLIIETKEWLTKCLTVFRPKLLLSPYVKGLIDNRGGVDRIHQDAKTNIGFTPFIGGICMIGLRNAWSEDSGGWEYPVPKHAGGDRMFCQKLSLAGYKFGYKEDVIIKHIETTTGQYKRYPKYFEERKTERKVVF